MRSQQTAKLYFSASGQSLADILCSQNPTLVFPVRASTVVCA